MENQQINKEQEEQMWRNWEAESRRGKVAGGLLIVIIGSLFLARELGIELPHWLFSWKTLLIGIGLVMGIKHRFRRPGWLIAVAIGSIFLLADVYPGLIVKSVLVPVILILAGLFMIFKPRRRYHHRHWRKWQKYKNYNWQAEYYCSDKTRGDKEDYVDANCVFGTLKRTVISKDFKGGEVTAVFGGAEINLNQADISDKARLELNAVFGGVTLIVPANWEIKSELNSVIGSIEDNRPIKPTGGSGKILILEGNTVCGGIEIKSY
jgi:predicted membrane protein